MIKKIDNADPSAIIQIQGLSVAVDGKDILHELELEIMPGTVHALMGPNGSGKSSLAYTLMGHPKYQVKTGTMLFRGQDCSSMLVNERACNGMFLAMQNSIEIPGLSVYTLLKEAVRARDVEGFSLIDFSADIEAVADILNISRAWLHRSLDSGFSGGEKKKLELLQMFVLKPVLAILDEVDSGLDIEAIVQMGDSLADYHKKNRETSFLVISHQKKFLDCVQPDYVYVMSNGKIVQSGDYSLIDQIESGGYDAS